MKTFSPAVKRKKGEIFYQTIDTLPSLKCRGRLRIPLGKEEEKLMFNLKCSFFQEGGLRSEDKEKWLKTAQKEGWSLPTDLALVVEVANRNDFANPLENWKSNRERKNDVFNLKLWFEFMKEKHFQQNGKSIVKLGLKEIAKQLNDTELGEILWRIVKCCFESWDSESQRRENQAEEETKRLKENYEEQLEMMQNKLNKQIACSKALENKLNECRQRTSGNSESHTRIGKTVDLLETAGQMSIKAEFIENPVAHPAKRLLKSLTAMSLNVNELKSTVSLDHILKSLIVIYDRAIHQLNEATELIELSILLYEQFNKPGNKLLSEKKFKIFVLSCLKYPYNKRIFVFLKLLGLGHIINARSYSKHTTVLYLSCLSYLTKGELKRKELVNHRLEQQMVELDGCVKCASIVGSTIFTEQQQKVIQTKLAIRKETRDTDVLIDLEAALEIICDTYNDIQREIFENLSGIQKILSIGDNRMYFTIVEVYHLLKNICNRKLHEFFTDDAPSELLEKCLHRNNGQMLIFLDKFVDLCVENLLFTNNNIDAFLGDFIVLDKMQTKSFILQEMDMATAENEETKQKIELFSQSIEEFETKHSLVSWFILKQHNITLND